jgi:putative transposase
MKQNYRKFIRLKEYDYRSDGYYFVTIVTKQRQKLLSGKEILIEQEILDLITKTKGLSVDYKVIMSNHLHIIFVLESSKLFLGEIVRRLKAKITRKLGETLWEADYYEHVIRNEGALNRIREYIINNPEAEILKFNQFYLEPMNRHATE